jgi:uncharacterized membrane protein
MNKKILLTTLLVLVALLGIASADSDFYDINTVYIDDIEVSASDVTQVELEDTVEIKVYIEGTGDATTCPDGDVDDCEVEAKVKAWIGGYEYDDIEAISSTFDIEPGVTYRKTLELEIPSDLDLDDNDYTLYVEVYDSEDYERQTFDLYIEKQRHSLDIMDVIFDTTVDAGDELPIEVRIKNVGEQKEEDIKVEVSLESLDSASTYIDELTDQEDDDDEETSDSANFILNIPEDAKSGSYTLNVKVTYDNGHETLERTYVIEVDGIEKTESETKETEIKVGTTSLVGTEGKSKTLELSFTNPSSEESSYQIKVTGIEQWASREVSPEVFELNADETKVVKVTITPDSDAVGEHEFSIQILDSNENLVKEIQMEMEVEESSNSWLKIGFMILIVLIVLIALIVIFKKLIKDDDDDDEDPLEPKEGKTYY